jgi:hypothetical protein
LQLDYLISPGGNNIYLSDKRLGDESLYVFRRQFEERYIGNMLQKPQLLLKRQKVRDTQFDKEVINKGVGFQNAQANKFQNNQRQDVNPFAGKVGPNVFGKGNAHGIFNQNQVFNNLNDPNFYAPN